MTVLEGGRAVRQFEGVLVSDIDGTVKRGCLEHRLAKILMRRDLIRKDRYAEALRLEREYRFRRVPYQAMVDAWVAANNSDGFEGVREEDMVEAAQELVREYGQRVYPFTRELIAACREAGYLTIAISGSSVDAVKPFCEQFGFDEAIGTIYPKRDGRYMAGPGEWLAKHKDIVMWRTLERYDYSTSGRGVIAIGDTVADFPMLRGVQYPIAFEPNDHLIDLLVSPDGISLRRPMAIVRDSKGAITANQIFVDRENQPFQRSCTLYDFLPAEIARSMDLRLGDRMKFGRSSTQHL